MWGRWALPSLGELFFAVVYGFGNLCFCSRFVFFNVGLACYLLYLIPNAAMMRLRKRPMKMFWVKKRNTNSMG